MSDYTERDPIPEPPSFTARFEKIERDLDTVKKALGMIVVGLATGKMGLSEDIARELGLRPTTILPASTGILGS